MNDGIVVEIKEMHSIVTVSSSFCAKFARMIIVVGNGKICEKPHFGTCVNWHRQNLDRSPIVYDISLYYRYLQSLTENDLCFRTSKIYGENYLLNSCGGKKFSV